jgi:DmsE family decaheme c-type cytochrome
MGRDAFGGPMARRIRKGGLNSWLACSFLVWIAAFGIARASGPPVTVQSAPAQAPAPQAPQPPQPKEQTDQPVIADANGFIGEKQCVDCHDSQKTGFFESKHHRATDPRSPAAKQSCETCHGPAGKHGTDDPVVYPVQNDFNKMKPAEVTAVCTTCHNRGEHALWDGSQHEARGLACTTCHASHAYKSETAQLKKENQIQVCATCHQDKIAKLQRSAHMPVREGKMECTTCHNTHGSTNVKLLHDGESVGEACTSCHAEKRGPYLWEHAPSRDGCVTCHDPHGSSNDRMLIRARRCSASGVTSAHGIRRRCTTRPRSAAC